jgi:hypothetical protein
MTMQVTTGDLDALETLPVPASRAELLERIPPARNALESTVASLDDAQFIAVGKDGWSVKDHLAHISAWERMIVAHMESDSDHEIVGVDAETYATLTLDQVNGRIYELHRNKAPATVASEFAAAHEAIMHLITGVSNDDHARRYWSDDTTTEIEKLTGDTYRHYLEHRRWIIEVLQPTPVT